MTAHHTLRLPLLESLLAGRSHVRRWEPRGLHLASWIALLSFRNGAVAWLLFKSHLMTPTDASCTNTQSPLGLMSEKVVLPWYIVLPPLEEEDVVDEDDEVSGSSYSSTASLDRNSIWIGRRLAP